jgi:sn-glycerol 3-phosphate transport system permease protein
MGRLSFKGGVTMLLDKMAERIPTQPNNRKFLRKSVRDVLVAWGYILPALLVFIVFIFWPLLYTVIMSFFSGNTAMPTQAYVGIKNYLSVLHNPTTLLLLKNTAIYIFILVIINFLVPFIMAFINHFVLKHGKKVYKVIIFMPSLISLVVGAMLIQWLFNPIIGPVSKLIVLFGATMPTWSKTPGLVIFVISLVACYKAFGYNFLVLLSGVSNVSNDLIEEAHLEKASNFTIFTKIVMPLTSSTAIYVLIMSIVQGVQFVFTPIKILTQGGPNDASSNILYGTYQEAFLYFNPGLASVLSVITMLIFIVLLILEFKYVEKGVYYEN